MSSLPVVQFCANSARLDVGAGRAAAVSSAAHARFAGSPNAPDLWARLTDDEREEVESWRKPEDTEFLGHALRYADAEKEVELAIDDFGFPVPFGEGLTNGHMDLGWVVTKEPDILGGIRPRFAIVGDLKRSKWTSTPSSLQIHAYGTAYALKHECVGYAGGIWALKEGEWIWGDRFYLLGSPEHDQIMSTILAAAANDSPDYATGPHCQDACYARLRCPAWTLPAALAGTWLGPIADKAGIAGAKPTPAELGAIMSGIEGLEDMIEIAKSTVKAHYSRGVRVLHGEKEWRYVGGGKKSPRTSVAKVREAFGEQAEKAIEYGTTSPSFRKVNTK